MILSTHEHFNRQNKKLNTVRSFYCSHGNMLMDCNPYGSTVHPADLCSLSYCSHAGTKGFCNNCDLLSHPRNDRSPCLCRLSVGSRDVIGPLGGYMLGFYLICLSGSFIRNKNRTAKFLALSAGLIACYALGTLWFMHFYGEDGLMAILITCVFPFVIPDIIKLVLAVMLSERLRKSGISGIPQH